MKAQIFIGITILIVLLAACAPVTASPTPPPIVTEEPSIPAISSVVVVQSVEIQILESDPLKANTIIRGQLPDAGCATIASVDQAREGNIFKITLTTTTS